MSQGQHLGLPYSAVEVVLSVFVPLVSLHVDFAGAEHLKLIMRKERRVESIHHTHSFDLPPVDRPKKVIKDLVAMSETHLARAQCRWVSVRPSSFDTFATGTCGSCRVVEIESAFTVFAMRREMKFGNNKVDL
jgi:hypothetical protein